MGEFLKSKFDSISLFILIMCLSLLLLHIAHDKQDDQLLSWIEQTITTVLGAYIGLTQVSRLAWNKNGGTNVPKTDSSAPTPASTPGVRLPDYPKQS